VESGAPLLIEPQAGTGATVDDANLREADRQSLTEASGIYAQYEMGGATVEPETFTPFSVIGDDERVAVNPTTGYPARAVVQILFETEFGAQHLCSGAMVSADTVLTAAHCIHSGTTLGQTYRNFRVIPARNVGAAPFGRCGARKAFVLAGWTGSQVASEARYFDLGGLKLDCTVGDATGWFGVRTLGEDEIGVETVVQGYAADLSPPGRQWVSRDELRILWELKGFYQNDTYGGTSGSPVFAADADNMIIGVHTNGLHGEEPWASHNAFTRITPLRLGEIRDWIEE
ncbi:MAG: serine protease, partial [Candidatus Krumholzibacteria bacterium]|nr:serine protease [Candidatus Krumholzibacteria bacterium]